MLTFLSDRSRAKHIANTSVWIEMAFGIRGYVMLRKRPITSRAHGPRRNAAEGRGAGRNGSAAVVPAGRPSPVPYAAMASPRTCFTIASFLHGTEVHPRTGATEPSSRATDVVYRPVPTRGVRTTRLNLEDTCFNRACPSPGKPRPLQGGQPRKEAPDDGTDGSWGDVFMTEDGFEDRRRDSAEVVPSAALAMGDDKTHDIPRGSGDGAFAAPGVFLPPRNLTLGISRTDRNDKSHWLLGGGFWGGLGVRLQTRKERWN